MEIKCLKIWEAVVLYS